MAKTREFASFECSVCGATMETWHAAWVPLYRLIAGPVRLAIENSIPPQK
jgi:hypothetical protein